MDCDVIPGPNEHNELLSSVDRIEENFGKKIDNLSADKAFGTGANLEGMETRNMNFHTPVESPTPQEGNPAKREDPRQPVPEADWPKLPRNDKKKLAKSCFVYDAGDGHAITVPMGKEMPYRADEEERRFRKARGSYGSTLARNCAELPAGRGCASIQKAKRGRTIIADAHEP